MNAQAMMTNKQLRREKARRESVKRECDGKPRSQLVKEVLQALRSK